MRHKLIGILSLLVCSLLFVVPANAVDLPACAAPDGTIHFSLVGQDQAIFEGSDKPKTIEGNVLVTGGPVKLGKNINIVGTVIADRIEFHSSGTSSAGECVANQITGPPGKSGASCITPPATTTLGVLGTHTPNDFNNFEAAHPTCVRSFANDPAAPLFQNLCGLAFVGDACANAANPLAVAEGATLTLPNAQFPSGSCIGALTLNKGAVLNLTGTYTFKQVTMKSGAQLNGPATVNVNGQFLTEPGVFITNITLNIASAQGDVLAIFNNSVLSGVVINAPFGRCHPHTGTSLVDCSEVCCKTLDIEPITVGPCEEKGILCECGEGFKFEVPSFANGGAGAKQRNCVKCAPGEFCPGNT